MHHTFDAGIAEKYGILEAVLVNHLDFWISKNRADGANYHDGTCWEYCSVKALSEIYPYATKRQIESALRHLRDAGVLKVGNYNRQPYDRTLWYAFTDLGESILRSGEMEATECVNADHRGGEPIPYRSTDESTDKDIEGAGQRDRDATASKTRQADKEKERRMYGEYGNVPLSDSDIEKLRSEFPDDWEQRIERVSEYCAAKGRAYKDYLAVIRSWARKDGHRPKTASDRQREGEFDAWLGMAQ